MSSKSLLLDIDGVLIRDRNLLNHVKDNCTAYVKRKFPAVRDPAFTNKCLYMSYGHTARGLRHMFDTDVSDFHQHVYDQPLIEHLCEVIYGEEFQREAKLIHDITDRRDWTVTLFTNAPSVWATLVKRAISDNLLIKCPPDILTEPIVKPDPRAYMFHDHHVKIMVDDSLKNLGTIRGSPNWIPVHFTEDMKENNFWCPQVNSIEDLVMYIHSVDMWISHNHFNKFSYR